MLISSTFFVEAFIVFKASLFIALLLHTQSASALPMQDPFGCSGRGAHDSFHAECGREASGNELGRANQWRRNVLNRQAAQMRARCLKMADENLKQRCLEMVFDLDI